MEDANPGAANANAGLVKRLSFFTGGNTVELMGRIHADIFYQQKYLPNDVTLRISLIRNKNEFCLMSTQAATNYKIKISECKI